MPEVDLSPEGRGLEFFATREDRERWRGYANGWLRTAHNLATRKAATGLLSALDRLEALEKVAEAARALAKSNQGHFDCEEDPWYSCPAHPDYSGTATRECACYFHEAEALRAALRSLDAGHPPAGEEPCG